MKKKTPTRERPVLPVAAKPKKRCAWRRRCKAHVDDAAPFCNEHWVPAERDYIFISGLNPNARVPHTIPWSDIVAAVRERSTRKMDTQLRHGILARACEASNCPGTDSCDTFYSCRNCMSVALPTNHTLMCAFPECNLGRLASDKHCSWHVRCIYTYRHGKCYLCRMFCPSGRLCPKCKPRCQYVVGSTDDGPIVCGEMHTRASRFCVSHTKK